MSQPELQQYLGDLSNATYDDLKAEYLWAKRRFRQFGQKSSRSARFPRKSWSLSMRPRKGGRKSKGKGRGKGRFHFEPSVINHSSLAGGKGKGGKGGKGKKGKGSQAYFQNPTGSDGQVMKCHECGSDQHLIASCPKKKGGKGKGGKGKSFMVDGSPQAGQYFQPGAFQGIVNGQSDNWYIGDSTVTVEEVTDDQDGWWTENSSTLPANLTIDTPFGPVSNAVATTGVSTASPVVPRSIFDVPQGVPVFALTDQLAERPVSKVKPNRLFAFPSWTIDDMRTPTDSETYLVRTRMATAPGTALLIDPGSPENLCGDQWSKEMQAASDAANRPRIKYKDLDRPLEVGGIGSGTQKAFQEGIHSIGLPDGTDATYTSPILPNSGTPALLGQKSLKKMHAVLDCFNNKLYLIGPGGLQMQLSPGSKVYQLEESHAGHLMLPCSRFSGNANQREVAKSFASTAEPGVLTASPVTVSAAASVENRFSREAWRSAAKL